MFVHSGAVCRKTEEHLWAGVVDAFPANYTGMDKHSVDVPFYV